MKEHLKLDGMVWKQGGTGSYEGPGRIKAIFKNWMGQNRYVIEHKIEEGRGYFYHIYSEKELTPPREPTIHDGG